MTLPPYTIQKKRNSNEDVPDPEPRTGQVRLLNSPVSSDMTTKMKKSVKLTVTDVSATNTTARINKQLKRVLLQTRLKPAQLAIFGDSSKGITVMQIRLARVTTLLKGAQ
jgi:hypothetical protein